MDETLTFRLSLSRGTQMFRFDEAIPLSGVTGIVGPSGSGKTTLLRALAGLEPDASGEVRFGQVVWQSPEVKTPARARRIGMVFQDGRLFDHLTVDENIRYGMRRQGRPDPVPEDLVETLGLRDLLPRQPSALSGGEVRRVALARALAAKPQILFLDEPLAALDRAAKDRLLPYLEHVVHTTSVPVLFVSHDLDEIDRLADRVLRISEGAVSGWAPSRPRLHGVVRELSVDGTLVESAGQMLLVPGTGTGAGAGQIGSSCSVALPRLDPVIATSDPGPIRGGFALRARLDGVDPPLFGIGGQSLAFPGRPIRIDLPIGTELWLIFAGQPRFHRRESAFVA